MGSNPILTVSVRWLVVVFLIGAVGGYFFSCAGTNSKVVALQLRADSVTHAAVRRDSVTTALAAGLRHEVDSLQKAKRPVTVKITADSALAAKADSAVRAAKTAVDSIAAYQHKVVALEAEIAGLRLNAHTDSVALAKALFRGDTLLSSVHTQTKAVTDLNAQIQALNHHALPKWFRVGFDVVQKGLALWKATELVHDAVARK